MKFYIYELIDPRDGQIFYIGKGSRNRVDHHEGEAARGVVSRKCDRIREIVASGHSVQKRIAARFADEYSAYEAERRAIEAIGLARLTNMQRGGVWANLAKAVLGREPFREKNIRILIPQLRRCLREYCTHGALFACGVDISSAFLAILKNLLEDVGIHRMMGLLELSEVEPNIFEGKSIKGGYALDKQ